MKVLYLLFILCFFNCNNKRVLQLPEIENAEVTEVLDVSPAYIFYDETQPDSTLLNRKNLISTTNWLVNVDTRLTLKQAIPHIKRLQEKKQKAKMHKNKGAKNYFTCNDTSISNLGFLDFTDVSYYEESSIDYNTKNSQLITKSKITIDIKTLNEISVFKNLSLKKSQINFLTNDVLNFIKNENITQGKILLVLNFSNKISFQDYISIKTELAKLKSDKIIISSKEFIY